MSGWASASTVGVSFDIGMGGQLVRSDAFINVDASDIYNKGWNDVTIPNDNINTNGPIEYIGGDNHIYNVYVRAAASNGKVGNKTIKVSATSAYNSGINKGANSLSIDPSTNTELDYDGSVTVIATTTNAYGVANNKSITITAPSNNYNSGWNDCVDGMSLMSNVYRISNPAPGTLYMQQNGNYIPVGSSWVQVTPERNAYFKPAKKT